MQGSTENTGETDPWKTGWIIRRDPDGMLRLEPGWTMLVAGLALPGLMFLTVAFLVLLDLFLWRHHSPKWPGITSVIPAFAALAVICLHSALDISRWGLGKGLVIPPLPAFYFTAETSYAHFRD